MRLSTPRISPLTPDHWTQEARTALALTHPELGGPDRPINVFTTLAHHPALLERFLALGNFMLFHTNLEPKDRQLLILRTGYLCKSKYEWGHHRTISKRAGLSDAEIERVKLGPNVPGWTPRQVTLLQTADELHADQHVSDATWQALEQLFDTKLLMEVMMVVGLYTLLSMSLNTFGVQLDPGVTCDVDFPA
jgi:4-carboxymuconolactone decarboxylase